MSIEKPTGLNSLIKELHKVFEEDHVNVEHVQSLMESYTSKESDWRGYSFFDPHKYTRNLVDSGNGKFNLMLLCWPEGSGSSIHDHADAHCFMKILSGQLKESLYDWPIIEEESEQLKLRKETPLNRNDVAYICDSIGLHRVENTSHTDKAVSLHLYCPPFEECSVFDQRTGHRRKCPVTFWTKYGKRTAFKEPQSAVAKTN